MNYLQLVNRARQECGVSGTDLTTLQTGLTLEGKRFATWIADAWNDLQTEKPDWQWMRKPFTFSTTASTVHYARADIVPDCADWKIDSFRAYTDSVGHDDEQILPPMSWEVWRNVYEFGTMRDMTGRPVAFAVEPDKSISLGPTPDTVYDVNGEYWRLPTDLSADADDPAATGNDFPERFHMLLVYDAMIRYAEYEAAAEVLQRGNSGYRRMRNRLMSAYLPIVGWGPPLA